MNAQAPGQKPKFSWRGLMPRTPDFGALGGWARSLRWPAFWPLLAAGAVLVAGWVAFGGLGGPVGGGTVTPFSGDPAAVSTDAPPRRQAQETSGWLVSLARVLAGLVALVLFVRLVDWVKAQSFADELALVLKLALAVAPVSVSWLASLDGVYAPMQEPLRSYLLLIAAPFVAAGVLVAFDRRRALWLGPLAFLAVAALALGAGALGGGLAEPLDHLRAALSTLAPDQRMWWLALATTPVVMFAAVSAIGARAK